MKNRRRQYGMTFAGAVFVFAVVMFVAYLGLKLGPVYLENHTLQQQLTQLQEVPEIKQASRQRLKKIVRKVLYKRLQVNNIRSVKLEDIKLESDETSLMITINYEVREHISGNIDVILSFENEQELKTA